MPLAPPIAPAPSAPPAPLAQPVSPLPKAPPVSPTPLMLRAGPGCHRDPADSLPYPHRPKGVRQHKPLILALSGRPE